MDKKVILVINLFTVTGLFLVVLAVTFSGPVTLTFDHYLEFGCMAFVGFECVYNLIKSGSKTPRGRR